MIRSANPRDYPKITPNALSTDEDVNEMLAAVKFVRRIASMPAMAEYIVEEILPGPSVQSDEALIADFMQRMHGIPHETYTIHARDMESLA